MRSTLFCVLFLLLSVCAGAQRSVTGVVTDGETRQPLPFATVKANHTNKGEIANLHGRFTISIPNETDSLQVTYLGYITRSVAVASILNGEATIVLQPTRGALAGVTIRPQGDKIKRILDAAIAHRAEHNPDKYDQYQW